MLNLDFPNQHVALSGIFARCTAWSQHMTEAAGNCLGHPMQKLEHLLEKQIVLGGTGPVCACDGRRDSRSFLPRHKGEGDPHILCRSLGPTSCEGTRVLFSQVHCAGVEANFTPLPAKPGVMLVQWHRGRAPLLSLSWELNTVLEAATGHAELSLFKGLGCVSRPRESLNHRQWKQL